MSSKRCCRKLTIASLWLLAVWALPSSDLHAATIDQFLRTHARSCATGPAQACFANAFSFVDQDRDQRVTAAEAKARHLEVEDWFNRNKARLAPIDRQAIASSLLTLRLVGLEPIFTGYDFNGDQAVDFAEITSDIKLDDRPIHRWIRDPDSVDWQAISQRLGPTGGLLNRLLIASGIK